MVKQTRLLRYIDKLCWLRIRILRCLNKVCATWYEKAIEAIQEYVGEWFAQRVGENNVVVRGEEVW